MNRKRLMLALASCALMAGVASATRVRVMTLGNVNHFVKDKANIQLYPQLINNYPVWGSMEIDGSTPTALYSVGGHNKFHNAVYGMYVSNVGIAEGGMNGPVVGENGATDGSTAPKLDLYYGRMLNDMPIGMNISIYQNSWKSKAAGNSAERSQMYFGLGFGTTLQNNIDLGLSIRTHTFAEKDALGNDVVKPNGGLKLNINGRYWHQLEENSYAVPYVGIEMVNQGTDSNNVGKMSDNYTAFVLGCGYTTKFTEGSMFVADVGFSFKSEEKKDEPTGGPSTTQKISTNTLPYYRFGFETPVYNWLVARVGAERKWDAMANDKVEETGSSTTNLYVGAGLRHGDFLLDLKVDPGMINRGPFFLTGSSGDWSTMASIRYMPSK